MNPDLTPDIAWVISVEHDQRPALGKDGFDLLSTQIPFVIERHDQSIRVDRIDELVESIGDFDFGIVRAFAFFAVDSFAGDAIDLRMIPSDQCLPDVVVAQIRMLVIRRVKVGNVGGEGLGSVNSIELVGRALEMLWVGEDVGDAEFDALVGAGCPGFEVGHLHACG